MTNPPAEPASSPRAASWKWLAVTLALVFLRALPNLRYLIGRDQATYCVIGQGLLRGQLLYRDLWDNKPPGIFYIYALIVKVFGPVMWSVGLVDILWLLVFSCCIFYFCRRYIGNLGGAMAAIFYACRHCRQGYIHAVQPEAFLLLGIFAAWFLLLDRQSPPVPEPWHASSATADPRRPGIVLAPSKGIARYFVIGLILGAAFWMKYNASAFFPFLALLPFLDFSALGQGSSRLRFLLPWKEWIVWMSTMATGLIFAVAMVLVSFHISGAWPAMKEIQFVVLPRYAAMSFHWSFYYFSWALWQTQNHMGVWWEVISAIALAIALWRRELGRIAPIALMALAGYICTAMQGRFHPYYFETTYPFFAMFWAYVGIKTIDGFLYLQRIFVRQRWALARGMLWVVFACLIGTMLPEELVRVAEQYRFAADWWHDSETSYKTYYWQLPLEKIGDQMRVVDYLKANSKPHDEVFVWGTAPLINFLPQRETPSRFVSNLGVMSSWAPESWRQELAHTLEVKRPRFIVVERHDMVPTLTFTNKDSEQYRQEYPALDGLLKDQYRPASNYSDFEVYESRSNLTFSK
jgi:hypothetical protein